MQPGHIFPVMAQPGGVLARAGHTEAGCDLARLAGLTPAAVICEIMKDDGTMARLPDLIVFAQSHDLKIGTIADLIQYRSRTERLVERIAERPLTTAHGAFRLVVYRDKLTDATHLALVRGPLSPDTETLVRVHEPLSVMDLLDSGSTSHSWTISAALAGVANAGRGVVVLLHRPESAQELRHRAVAAEASGLAEDGPAQLRHRRADPARSQCRPDALAGEAAQDAEHDRLRSRGDGLCRAAAASRRRRRVPRMSDLMRISPNTSGDGRRVGIVLSRFNAAIGDQLLAGALRALAEAGVAERDIVVVTVPGALETPLALQRLAQTGDYDALVALGAVIRGETYHFEIVANESAARRCERAARVRHPDRQRHPHDRHRRAGARACRREGLRGGAGGARAREPARRDR